MNKRTRGTKPSKSVSSAALVASKSIRKRGNGRKSKQYIQAEVALRESEEKYRSLFEYAKDAILLADMETGLILDVNTAGCNLVGLPKGKLIGKSQAELHPPELVNKYQKLFKEKMQKGVFTGKNFILQKADGKQIPIDITASMVKMGDKTVLQGIFRDVSDRLRMEKALKESEEKISKAFRSIPEAVSIATLKDGVFLEVNDSFLTLNGYSRDEIIGHNAKELNIWVNPEDRYRMKQLIEKQDRFENEEFLLRRKTGETRTVLLSADIITYEGKSCILTIGTDITERKRVEEALRESEEKFHSIVENGNDGITFIQNGVVQYCNSKMQEMVGYTEKEALGKPFINFVAPEHKEKVIDIYKKRLAGEEVPDRYELNMMNKDGRTMYTEVSASLIDIKQDKLDIAIVRDITERKEMEQALIDEAVRRRILVEQSHDGIVVLDWDGKVYEANQKFADMLGYSHEEVQDLHVFDWEFLYPHEQVIEMIRTVDEKGDHFETQHRRKDGTIYDVEISTNGAMFAGQKLVFCVCRDITERKKMEQSIQESEEKFSKAFHASPQTVIITRDKDDATLEVNDTFTKVTGFTHEETIGKTSKELGVWQQSEDMARLKQLLKDNGRVLNEEFEFISKKGQKNTQLVSVEPITIGGEKCWLSILTDITERKRRENLQKAENNVLMLLSEGAELNEILDAIVQLCEQNDATIKGSIMLYDASKNLLIGSGPSLSEEYNSVMKMGIPAGPVAGSCGTAAYRKRRVIVKNIKASPLFKPFKEGIDLATKNGLRAVWSEPIISSSGDILGTIANYSNHTGGPTANNIEVLEWSARIAAVAIERKNMEKALKESEEKFSTAFHAMPEGVSIARIKDGVFIDVNESFCRDNNYTREEVIGHRGEELNLGISPSQRDEVIKILKKQGHVDNMEFEFNKKSGEPITLLLSAEKINISGEPCLLTISSNITERKKIERALKESEEKINKAFQAIPEAISIVSLEDDVFLEVNDSFISVSGYSREETIGHTTGEIVHWANPDDSSRMEQLKDKQTHFKNEEFVFRNKSGETITLLMSGDVINFGGKPCTLTIGADITERKEMVQALRESEEKFSKAFRAIPEAVSIVRMKDGAFVDVNDSFCTNIGYKYEDVIGHNESELITWVDPSQREKIFKSIFQQGRIQNIESELKIKSGEIRTILMSAEVININGEPCVLNINSDITERKQMEQALQESEEKFSKAFHAIPETLSISTLKEGRFVDVNESFLKLNQVTREEVIGRTGEDLGFLEPGDERNKIRELLKKQTQFNNEEIEFKAPISDSTLTFLFSADTIEIGGEPCLLIIGNDITKRKQAQKNLQQALADLEQNSALLKSTNKELESFSYSVSHDLRSPLRSIDGFSQALLEDYKETLDEKGQDYLNRLRNASQKMGELIDGLLKLSRLTRSEMHYETVDLSSLAAEIATRLQETHDKRDAKFIIGKDLTANGDPQMLRVLLENLLGNAWKFTKNTPQAMIEFGSTTENGTKTFFIKDNGAGFDMAFKDKLFGAFQRLHDTAEFPGTGIGLATVQRIINRHGGIVRAEGAPGKGASFYFTLN